MYHRKIEFIDFISFGKKFTQVVVRLDPVRPRTRNGKKLVIIASEGGSEYGMDFLETVEGKDGIGIWLAKRGITFIALTRVGRWNFLASDGTGSWKEIALGQRMPIFERVQRANWPLEDYSTQTVSEQVYRFPKPGSELFNQMLAASPVTLLLGYQKALNQTLPELERKESILLYWGLSTGGAYLWPLAKYIPPTGYLGWGTSTIGLAHLYRESTQNDYEMAYDKSALRVWERGRSDFEHYTPHIDQATRNAWWQMALKQPRFKSVEDPTMQFSLGALAEMAVRLWRADFLPSEYKEVGFARFVQNIMEPLFPSKELEHVSVLEVNGTLDEAIPPDYVDAHRTIMEPYCRKYRVARIEGFHHYLFTQESIKVVGSVWLRFIESGYYD